MMRKFAFLAWFACLVAHAQDTQFLPEVDGHLKLSSKVQITLQAKDDREGGDPEQFTFGPSILLYPKPLAALKKITIHNLDEAGTRALVVESGYRFIAAPGTPDENRAIEALTIHFPLVAGFHFIDRNRSDLDWQNNTFTWRYRNRLTVERTFSILSHHFIPYFAAEPFYESKYSKWSATDIYGGIIFPIGKHVQLDGYYQHENNTAKKPNKQDNYGGLALHLYFSLKNTPKPKPAP
jgi:hypothetical protein